VGRTVSKLAALLAIAMAIAGGTFSASGGTILTIGRIPRLNTSSRIEILKGAQYRFDSPTGIIGLAGTVWVANSNGDNLTPISASSLLRDKSFENKLYGISNPYAVAGIYPNIWTGPSGPPTATTLFQFNVITQRTSSYKNWKRTPIVVDPVAMTSYDTHLFIASYYGPYVTEVNNVTGNPENIYWMKGASPTAVDVTPGTVWVIDGSVPELYEFSESNAKLLSRTPLVGTPGSPVNDMTVVNGDLWIPYGNSIDIFSVSTGAMIGTLDSPKLLLSGNSEYLVARSHNVWITCGLRNAVVEINANTHLLEADFHGPSYGFSDPTGIVLYRGEIWVTNRTGGGGRGSVTVFPIT
jgi:hypothetical protein